MIIYLMIGMAWSMLIAWLYHNTIEKEGGELFNAWDALVHIVIWPLSIITFVYNFLKGPKSDD